MTSIAADKDVRLELDDPQTRGSIDHGAFGAEAICDDRSGALTPRA
jgi:hypothetical protein